MLAVPCCAVLAAVQDLNTEYSQSQSNLQGALQYDAVGHFRQQQLEASHAQMEHSGDETGMLPTLAPEATAVASGP